MLRRFATSRILATDLNEATVSLLRIRHIPAVSVTHSADFSNGVALPKVLRGHPLGLR